MVRGLEAIINVNKIRNDEKFENFKKFFKILGKTMTAVNQSNESYSLLVMIAFLSTLFLTLIICAIVGAIIISFNKKSRLERELKTQKTLNHYGFVGGFELYDDTTDQYDLDLYEFIDSDIDESDHREYDKVNYDKLNIERNENVEYTQIFE